METIYTDSLVTITQTEIIFRHYYFPAGKEKRVALADIERIEVKPSTLLNGKWRIHGTGNFKVWFPRDIHRAGRDRIFFAVLKRQWIDIGFTVEDGNRVEQIFRDMNLIPSQV